MTRPLSNVLVAALAAIPLLLSSLEASAQTEPHDPPTRGTYFVGGSAVLWSTLAATEDPPGAGYLVTYYHGSLDSPVVGATFGGGVYIARSWSVGGEVAFRRSQSGVISEDGRAKFESWHLSPLHTDRERLMSVVTRRHFRRGTSLDVQPLGGLTFSRSSQSLTNRRGEYVYYGGTVPIERPDVRAEASRWGLVGGADVLFGTRHGVAVACGARLHWIRRPDASPYVRMAPVPGPAVVQVSAGVTWQSHRR